MPNEEKNQMVVNGRGMDDSSTRLTINLADDQAEVRGFGQAITRERAKQMAEAYFLQCEKGAKLIDEILTKEEYAPLRTFPGFAELRHIIDPKTQTVSGVFGKEIILQILSMRQCEGIRYVIGNDGKQNTVIIMGVTESGVVDLENGSKRAKSAPVQLETPLRSILGDNDVPVDGEVHNESLTIAGVRDIIANDFNIDPQKPADVLFGEY